MHWNLQETLDSLAAYSYQSLKIRLFIKLFVALLQFAICGPVSFESGCSGNKTPVVAVAGDNQAFNSRPQVLGY
jgi:hypothetical protein